MAKKKYYIDRDAWLERLQEEMDETDNPKRKMYIQIQMNSIICRPTLTREDILKEEEIIEE